MTFWEETAPVPFDDRHVDEGHMKDEMTMDDDRDQERGERGKKCVALQCQEGKSFRQTG